MISLSKIEYLKHSLYIKCKITLVVGMFYEFYKDLKIVWYYTSIDLKLKTYSYLNIVPLIHLFIKGTIITN